MINLYYNKISDILDQIKRVHTREDKIAALKLNRNNEIFMRILLYTYSFTHGKKHYPIKKIEPEVAKNELSIDTNFDIIDNLFTIFSVNSYLGHETERQVTKLMESFDKDSQDIVNMMLKHDLECGIDKKMLIDTFGSNFKN